MLRFEEVGGSVVMSPLPPSPSPRTTIIQFFSIPVSPIFIRFEICEEEMKVEKTVKFMRRESVEYENNKGEKKNKYDFVRCRLPINEFLVRAICCNPAIVLQTYP